MSLSVANLTVLRSGRTVVSEVSLEARAGEAILLRGPNGVGKSTLLRALAGLLPVASGTAILEGIALPNRDDWQARIAVSGHLDAIKPQLTVAENLTFWARLFGGDVDRAMERFRLTEIADRPAHACSAGQKRRTGLARLVLAEDRPLWLLDEPTVSLDTATVALFADVVRGHLARGGIALVATHIDLGLPDARVMDLTAPRARPGAPETDPFLAGAGWT